MALALSSYIKADILPRISVAAWRAISCSGNGLATSPRRDARRNHQRANNIIVALRV